MPNSSKIDYNYWLLFLSMLFSTFGSFLFFLAIEIKVFTDNTAFALFLSIFAYTIPPIVFVPLATKYTYTLNKRFVIICCYILRLLTSIYLIFFHNLNEIYLSLFLLSFFAGIAFVAQKTLLHAMIKDQKSLIIKNSWYSSMEMVMELLGGIIGSLMIFFISFEAVALTFSLTLALSLFFVLNIKPQVNDSFAKPFSRIYTETFKTIFSNIDLLVQIIFFCIYMVFGSIFYGFLIAFVFENFEESREVYSFFLFVSGLGSIFGAWIISRYLNENINRNIKKIYFFSFLIATFTYVSFSYTHILSLNIILCFMFSISSATLKHSHQALIYDSFPFNLQESAWSILNIIWHLTILISSLFTAILIENHGINWVLQKSSLFYFFSLMIFLYIYKKKHTFNKLDQF